MIFWKRPFICASYFNHAIHKILVDEKKTFTKQIRQ